MNEFYHAVLIEYNNWFVLLPAQIVFMMLFGFSTAKLNKVTNRIMQRDKEHFLAGGLSIVMDIVLIAFVLVESSAGIIQLFDNCLSVDDDPVWSLVLFCAAMIVFAIVMYYIFLGSSILGKEAKKALLEEVQIRRER